jgi:hypothetical protein
MFHFPGGLLNVMSWTLIFNLICFDSPAAALSDVHVAITMICRNEEVNFRSNLALWLPVVEFYVFMLDDRTTDSSRSVIQEILDGKARYKIFDYEFEGFGPARTASLAAVWDTFPGATHVIIADPGSLSPLELR